MSDINDLGLSDEAIPVVDLDNLPAEGFELPQPGQYLFTLPTDLSKAWEKLITPDGERIQLNLKKTDAGDFRLKYKRGDEEGLLSLNLSNKQFGKRPPKLAYLAAALGYKGQFDKNKELAEAITKAAGSQFIASVVYTARNKNTDQRWATRGYVNKKDGRETRTIPRDSTGKAMMEFVDDGTLLKCWPDLEAFKPAK